MKSLWIISINLIIACFVFHPNVEAIKETEYHKWLTKRIEKLDDAGNVVQTSFGPIQYVWKGNRNKPVIVCCHGAFGGWDQALLMGQNFLKEGFSVLAISRPGYLASTFTFPGIMSNADQANAIVEVMNALKIQKASVIGFSAGGPVAFQIANLHPNRVSALVLESIGAQSDDALIYIFLAALLNYEQLTGDTDTLDFETYMIFLAEGIDPYSTGSKILSMDNNLTQKNLNNRIEYVFHHDTQKKFLKNLILSLTPLSPRLDGIENDVILAALGNWPIDPLFYQNLITPTRIVQGIHDTNGNFAVAQYVNSQVARSQLISVKGCGHFVWLGKHTKEWEAQITAFLKANL